MGTMCVNKNNKKGFCMYVSQRRKIKEIIPPPLTSKTGKLITTDKEKAEILHNFLLQSPLAVSLVTPL